MKYTFTPFPCYRLGMVDYRFYMLDYCSLCKRTIPNDQHFLSDPYNQLQVLTNAFDDLFRIEQIDSLQTSLDMQRSPLVNKLRNGVSLFIATGDDVFQQAASALNEAFSVDERITSLPTREESDKIAVMREAWSTEEMMANLTTIGLVKTFNQLCAVEDEMLENMRVMIDASESDAVSRRKRREELYDIYIGFQKLVEGVANLKNDPVAQDIIARNNTLREKYRSKIPIKSKRDKDELDPHDEED